MTCASMNPGRGHLWVRWLFVVSMALASSATLGQQPAASRLTEAIGSNAPAASPPPSTVSGAVAAPIERDSPRAALALFFAATRAGRWDDAAHYLVLSEDEKPLRRTPARRLKGVVDGHRWNGLEAVSGALLGRLDDDLPPDLEEIERIAEATSSAAGRRSCCASCRSSKRPVPGSRSPLARCTLPAPARSDARPRS
ncbi:MAG: hypothetical protein ABIV63_14190 [Caldimonas sp.]